jgi:hypothetical protein
MLNIALVLGNNQRRPRDLSSRVPQLDVAKVLLGYVGWPHRLATPVIDLSLDGPHLLISNDEEVIRLSQSLAS